MKIPVFCSLIPTELLTASGAELDYLSGEDLFKGLDRHSQCVFHDNLCPYVKAVYDNLLESLNKYDLIIIPSGCDGLKKMYNALKTKSPAKPIFLLDIPRMCNEAAVEFLAEEFRKLAKVISNSQPLSKASADVSNGFKLFQTAANKIGFIGSNVPDKFIIETLTKNGFEIVYLNHCIEKSKPTEEGLHALHTDSTLKEYARYKLENNRCPRNINAKYITELTDKVRNNEFAGLIINTFKFCDFQPFDYIQLTKLIDKDFPTLLLEHEGFVKNEGQIMTRIEAFLEKLKKNKPKAKTSGNGIEYFVGIDSGSHATKLVCVDKNAQILFHQVIPTGVSVKESSKKAFEHLQKKLNCKNRNQFYITATGYGRNQIQDADHVMTEITCHAIGAFKKFQKPATVIDIGGQDSKVIKIGEEAKVLRFSMNDKCAAGTGRFLEVIAERLGLTLAEFSKLAGETNGTVPISNMCTVFAESEVISLIAAGHPREHIAKGIHQAIAERTVSLVKRTEGEPPYYMTGGVAKNKALVKELSKALGKDVVTADEPQLNGAHGAAIISMENCLK